MWFLAALLFFQTGPQHFAYEGVIHERGKTIGTTILLEVSGQTVTGWIQKHDYFPIQNGVATDTGYTFDAAGNHYQIDKGKGRIVYSGADGSGDQRVNAMEPLVGRVYKIREETEEGREMTLQTDHGDFDLMFEDPPAIWKRNGPPIRKFDFERFEEILGKTITLWRIRTGGTWDALVIDEPAGMDILDKKALKEAKKKKKQ